VLEAPPASTRRRNNLPMSLICSALLALSPSGADFDLEEALRGRPKTAAILAAAEEHRLQMLLVQVERRDGRWMRVREQAFRVDAYPASAIKLIGAVAAVLKMQELARANPAIGLDTPLSFEPLFPGEEAWRRDPTNLEGGVATLRHEIRKLFLVSDNPAYNRCFDYAGRDELHRACEEAGLDGVRAVHRLSVARTEQQNRMSPRILWRDEKGEWRTLLEEREAKRALAPQRVKGFEVGTGWRRDSGELVAEPMDFSTKNRAPLGDLQAALAMLVDPRLVAEGAHGFALSEANRRFLLETAMEHPEDSANPRYEDKSIVAERFKFLLRGLRRHVREDEIVYANKIGRAYGFSTENAFVAHEGRGVGFLFAATIYTNRDGILNDDKYEYAEVADPFFEELGDLLGAACFGR
jgi:hypothetical protein